jgi:hypothetical protein
MARTDDVPIRITASDYRTAADSELAQWLAKEAAGGGGEVPETNEATGTAAYSDLYDDPKGRKDVTNVDGHWGKKPQQTTGKDPFHQNRGTYVASQEERHVVTGRALDSLPAAEANAQAILDANFDHARSGEFTAHSLLLQGKTKEGSVLGLSERVRRIIEQF